MADEEEWNPDGETEETVDVSQQDTDVVQTDDSPWEDSGEGVAEENVEPDSTTTDSDVEPEA